MATRVLTGKKMEKYSCGENGKRDMLQRGTELLKKFTKNIFF